MAHQHQSFRRYGAAPRKIKTFRLAHERIDELIDLANTAGYTPARVIEQLIRDAHQETIKAGKRNLALGIAPKENR